MDPLTWMKHFEQFRSYKPTLDDYFDEPNSSKRKPIGRKWTRKLYFESSFDRLDKKEKQSWKSFTLQDPNALEKISYELFLRSLVLRLVNWYQGNCRDKLFSNYYLNAECLKEYAWCISYGYYEALPLSEITFGKDTLARLSEEVYLVNMYLIIGFLLWFA